ncbi:MAG TPA: AmmeMemoRadiSam system protein A [Thermoanaerobaculia bacterium]|nr:AmmeMemoRadiSam system protein A [Thermoanaerobaculia bacterium]
MAPGASPEPGAVLGADERGLLLDLARRAIRAGLDVPWLEIDLERLPAALRAPGASFVTLTERGGGLRGCMGRLEATRPLAEDVAGNARAAAFFDPRFPPVEPGELDWLEIEVSVLSAAAPLAVASERELLAALRPGIDGLIVEAAGHRATFLPSVWATLPDPREFVVQLRRKAGLGAAGFEPGQRYSRYTAEKFGGAL